MTVLWGIVSVLFHEEQLKAGNRSASEDVGADRQLDGNGQRWAGDGFSLERLRRIGGADCIMK